MIRLTSRPPTHVVQISTPERTFRVLVSARDKSHACLTGQVLLRQVTARTLESAVTTWDASPEVREGVTVEPVLTYD